MKNNFIETQFQNSKSKTVISFIFIILVIIAFYFLFKNKDVEEPVLSDEDQIEIITDSMTENEIPALAVGEKVIIDTFKNFRYTDSVMGESDLVSISVISKHLKLRNSASTIEKPDCGNYQQNISPCEFFMQKDGIIEKITDWPDASTLSKIHGDISYLYKHGSLRSCLDQNYMACSGDKIYFTALRTESCMFTTQEWSLDVSSKKFLIEKETTIQDCD